MFPVNWVTREGDELTIIKQLHQTGRCANRDSRLALGEELLLLFDLKVLGKLGRV